MEIPNRVAILELRRLLFELKELRPDIYVRFRLLGEMWQTSFAQVIKLTERGVIICNESMNEVRVINDLNSIVQFELDSTFQQYQPHNHYSVEPFMSIANDYASTGS